MFEALQLDWDAVRMGVRTFNRSASSYSVSAYFLAENSMSGLFSQTLTAESLPLGVMAINSLWRTNLQFEKEGVVRVSEFIVSRLSKVRKGGADLTPYELPVANADLEVVVRVAQQMLRLCLPPSFKKTPFSFATKLLHLCCPAALPIYDDRSRKTMNVLLRGSGLKPAFWRPGKNFDECKQMYDKLIRFYNTALARLTDRQRPDLITFDHETQPKGFRRNNSLVRILDKYLYTTES